METTVGQVSTLVARIEEAVTSASESAQILETAEYGPIIQQVDDGRHWLYFRWGLGVGVVLVLAVVIAVWVYNSKGT